MVPLEPPEDPPEDPPLTARALLAEEEEKEFPLEPLLELPLGLLLELLLLAPEE